MFMQNELIAEMKGLKRFAWKLTGNEPDADDLLQSTVLRALEKNHLFESGTNLFSWTSKIMYNQFVNGYRRKVKFESKYDPQPYIDMLDISPAQERKVEFTETGIAMANLSEEHRQILFMICVQGLKYKSVARKLGIPIGTVRSRLNRAREQLRLQLNSSQQAKKIMH